MIEHYYIANLYPNLTPLENKEEISEKFGKTRINIVI